MKLQPYIYETVKLYIEIVLLYNIFPLFYCWEKKKKTIYFTLKTSQTQTVSHRRNFATLIFPQFKFTDNK